MESNEFKARIVLGNEAMSSGADVAFALRRIADALIEGRDEDFVRDENGNTVGAWRLT